jgi:hypothetical protein
METKTSLISNLLAARGVEIVDTRGLLGEKGARYTQRVYGDYTLLSPSGKVDQLEPDAEPIAPAAAEVIAAAAPDTASETTAEGAGNAPAV